jgi:hypothetical protein
MNILSAVGVTHLFLIVSWNRKSSYSNKFLLFPSNQLSFHCAYICPPNCLHPILIRRCPPSHRSLTTIDVASQMYLLFVQVYSWYKHGHLSLWTIAVASILVSSSSTQSSICRMSALELFFFPTFQISYMYNPPKASPSFQHKGQ